MRSAQLAVSLAALTGVFFAVNWHLLNEPVDVSPIDADLTKTTSFKKDENTQAIERNLSQMRLSATIDRPLFSRERRKFVPPPPPKPIETKPVAGLSQPASPAASQPQSPVPAPDITVIGVSLSEAKSSALITGDAENRWVYLGESVNAWTVDAIDGDGVLLRNGKQKLRLNLYTAYGD